jgi:hypothetical protein
LAQPLSQSEDGRFFQKQQVQIPEKDPLLRMELSPIKRR